MKTAGIRLEEQLKEAKAEAARLGQIATVEKQCTDAEELGVLNAKIVESNKWGLPLPPAMMNRQAILQNAVDQKTTTTYVKGGKRQSQEEEPATEVTESGASQRTHVPKRRGGMIAVTAIAGHGNK